MKKLIIINLFILLAITGEIKSQWLQNVAIPPGGGITDMVVTPGSNIIVTRGSFNYPNGQLGGISWSSNQGGSWISPVNVFTARTLELSSTGAIVYASVWNYPQNEGLYRSLSEGNSWTGPLYSVGANDNIFSICSVPNILFIGTRNGVLKSTSGGSNFFPVNNGIPPNSWVYDIAFDTSSVIDGTVNFIISAGTTNGLFISSNLGSNWQQTAGIPTSDTITAIEFAGSKLIAGSDDGSIFISVFPFTTSSNSVSLTNHVIEEMRRYAMTDTLGYDLLYLAARPKNPQQPGGGVYVSTNTGVTFASFSDGLPQNPVVSSLGIRISGSSLQLYTGLYNNTINGGVTFKRTVLIGIEPISTEVPQGFSLSQNYPNPFNPSTTIKFQIPKFTNVKLIVHDILGKEISMLVNEDLRPGTYEVDWDGGSYSSGVYLCTIQADGYRETKKLLLVR